jgi:acetone carboxylase alpha subunit
VNVFEVMEDKRDLLRFSVEEIMNEQPFPGARYSSHHMGLQLEFADPGELYMITQGSGGGYGDVLERDPELVAKDYLDGLISMRPVTEIYHVALDEQTGAVDVEATRKARDAVRAQRLADGTPYKDFVAEWETEKPPVDVPFYGSWSDRGTIYMGTPDKTCPADAIVSVMMPDPKDVRIAALEAELAAVKGQS